MRTDSFSKEKHLPVRRFIADESKVATGLYGPRAIADDLDNLFCMFDPEATFLDGSEQGGISEKNLQNGAVSYEKLGDDVKAKFQDTITEQQLLQVKEELLQKNNQKADKSSTLSGYGISDAYTSQELDEYFSEQEAELSKKTEETILYEDVVNTPEWKIQPTVVSGDVASVFSTNDFYYVTLKDASGNSLPSGQFMLKNNRTTNSVVYPVVFSLPNLHTGAEILIENFPIEFTSIGIVSKMRDAGVWNAEFNPSPLWDLSGNKGTIKIETFGQFIQRGPTGYFISSFKTNGKVSHYHSNESSAFQNASTQQIVPYIALSNYNYRDNLFLDVCVLKKYRGGKFFTQRNLMLHMMKDGTTAYSQLRFETHGIGTVLQENVSISGINIQLGGSVTGGVIRNGSIIRVTEVK